MRWLVTAHPAAAQGIHLVGFSMGSMAALSAAGTLQERDTPAKGLVLFAPFHRMKVRPAGFMGRVFGRHEYDNRTLLRTHRKVPTLVLHGGADSALPLVQGELVSRGLGARLMTYPGIGHAELLKHPPRSLTPGKAWACEPGAPESQHHRRHSMSAAPESPRCFIIGEGTLVVPCAQALTERGVQILGLVTREPALQKWAEEQGVPHVPPGEQVLPFLSQAPFDWLFSIVNLSMVKEDILRLPRRMAINFHDGPLPRYAGLNVTSWALLNREPRHGVTWHEMTTGADEGRVLKQRLFDIAPGETAFSLNARCYTLGMETFAELAEELVAGTSEAKAQDFSQRSYFGLAQRPEAAAVLDLHGDVDVAHALVSALDYGGYPNPLAFAKVWLGNGPVAISEARRAEPASEAAPGTVLDIEGDALTVALQGGDLTLKGPKGPCGAPLSWADLLGARMLARGDVLPPAPPELRARLTEVSAQAGKAESFFLRRLETLSPPDLPFLGGSSKDVGTHTLKFEATDVPLGWATDLPPRTGCSSRLPPSWRVCPPSPASTWATRTPPRAPASPARRASSPHSSRCASSCP
ncbi:formyltransferase family protein [Myxococcus sp. MxC21-1]|uniref:formyltransferase family protein n=1 Tax=Myxococcus sp. MxC21-1 TaxID=3041439 RepID=UPI00292E053C|nr:formyltransferase family protein [Myxococcus sp. MxC21-1]WNZ64827.1 formyltransferase family protein [Myxococcus sp. MxC21-1]